MVTANKALLAVHGADARGPRRAERHGVALAFEAAVAGGIPVIKALREGLAGNRISRVAGILNGTCNYILTTMRERGREFADVLAEAQKLGYAEADPSFDIDGIDAAHKLAILAALAFGRPVAFDDVHVEGIRRISAVDIAFARELGYRIKLLGIAHAHRGRDRARGCIPAWCRRRRRSRRSRACSTPWWRRAISSAASCWRAAAPAPGRPPRRWSPTWSTSRAAGARRSGAPRPARCRRRRRCRWRSIWAPITCG